MLKIMENLNPILLAFIFTTITYIFNILGASLVYFIKDEKEDTMNIMLSISGGIMLAASFFSLLSPAIEKANELGQTAWLVVSVGFILGILLLLLSEKLASKILKEGTSIQNIMLILSMTVHNIPEGLVIGVAFGSLVFGNTLISAISLALGIGIQNFPEGSSIALPLRNSGLSKNKSFMIGQISGVVEPIAGVIGALLVSKIESILPFTLAFASGAMIYVVIKEIFPELNRNTKKDQMAFYILIGFIIMMILDISLG